MQTLVHYVNGYNDPGFWIVSFVNGEVVKSRLLKLSTLSASSIKRLFGLGALGAGRMLERKVKP